jgi:hypothetical protein
VVVTLSVGVGGGAARAEGARSTRLAATTRRRALTGVGIREGRLTRAVYAL